MFIHVNNSYYLLLHSLNVVVKVVDYATVYCPQFCARTVSFPSKKFAWRMNHASSKMEFVTSSPDQVRILIMDKKSGSGWCETSLPDLLI